MLANIKPGDEVIIPSYTFVSTALAFVRQGAKIIFADSGANNPNIDVDLIEPLITKSKTDSTHSRRTVFSYLKNKEAVSALFRDVAPKVATRNGGYTRIIRLGFRLGDNAEMCMIELVDFNELMLANEAPKKATTRRSRKPAGAKAPAASTETSVEEVASEETTTPEVTSEDSTSDASTDDTASEEEK
jgi:large subunit ribosomal protein L17